MVKDKKELWAIAVEEHNKYRRRHGVPDLKGDDEKIHNTAQNYAQYLASRDLFQHSSGTGYGENLAGAQGSDEAGAIRSAVKMWYDEISSYNYNYPGFSMGTGHFTAVVWKSTTHLGIGIAYNQRKRWWVVVGNYNPPGNYQGRFPANVPRLLSSEEIKRIEKERSGACEQQAKQDENSESEDSDSSETSSEEESESDNEPQANEKEGASVKTKKLSNNLWQVAVDEHNKYRRRHGVPDIKGDDEKIHSVAQRYAQYLASNDLFQHSSGTGYGENLAGALGDNEEAAIRFAVKMWYDEIKSYNYGYPGFSMTTGHFTAVVWKSTTHIGIGVAYNSRKRWWVVVGNYNPPGNFQGRFPDNVPRLLSADAIKRIEKERSSEVAKVDEKKEVKKPEKQSESKQKEDEKASVSKKMSTRGDKKVVKTKKLSNELWQLAVDEHNKYRRRHGAPNLKGDDEKIHKSAQNHATYLSQFSGLVHANNGYAESLAAVQAENSKDAIRKAIKQWYDEKSHYNFNYPNFYSSAGHFTHMVWKASTHVGIGVAHNKSMGWWVVVANYTPRGNVMTQFGDNVLREGQYSEEEEEEDSDEEGACAEMGKLKIEDKNKSSAEEESGEEEEAASDKAVEKLNSVMKVAVEEHNKYRRRHGVPDMKPSDELHGIAQRYAEYLASHDLFQHSGTHYENLAGALGETKEDAIRYAVKMWYDENKVYNYSYGGFSMQTGHFTAMIWKTTTNIGIGVAYNPKKRWWIVVGNYSPPGNMAGQFQQNVLPPRN